MHSSALWQQDHRKQDHRKPAMTIFKQAVLVLASGLILVAAHSQGTPPAAGARPPGIPETEALSAAELIKIKTILAPYKPASLDTNTAKSIKRSLRDAGFRRSRALDSALLAAGFSPEKMDTLDPPPPRPPGESAPPTPRPQK